MDKILKGFDQVMAFCFYASIFFLPIAPAIMEGLFVVILVCYLVKRGIIFYSKFPSMSSDSKRDPFELFKVFQEAYRPVENPLSVSLSIYLFIAFLSVLLSYYPVAGFKGFVFKLLQGVFTYFLFLESVNTKKRLKIFLGVFLSSILVISLNGIFQHKTGQGFIHHHSLIDGRITSSFNHPNDFGGYLVMIIPMLFSLSILFPFFAKKRAGERQKASLKSGVFKFLMLVVLFFAVTCIGGTYSRGAWIGFVASFIFLGMKRPKLFIPLIIAILLFGATFVPKMLQERTSAVSGPNGSLLNPSSRIQYWASAIQLIKEEPFFGVGLNAYSQAGKHYPKEIYWRGYPHNCYLHVMAETGILGLAAFFYFLYSLYKYSLKALNSIKDQFSWDLLAGILAGFTGFLVHSFFDTSFFSTQLDALMWLIIGFMVSVIQVDEKERALNP